MKVKIKDEYKKKIDKAFSDLGLDVELNFDLEKEDLIKIGSRVPSESFLVASLVVRVPLSFKHLEFED